MGRRILDSWILEPAGCRSGDGGTSDLGFLDSGFCAMGMCTCMRAGQSVGQGLYHLHPVHFAPKLYKAAEPKQQPLTAELFGSLVGCPQHAARLSQQHTARLSHAP